MHKKSCKTCASLCTLIYWVLIYSHCNPPIHYIVLLHPIRNKIPSPKRTANGSGPFYLRKNNYYLLFEDIFNGGWKENFQIIKYSETSGNYVNHDYYNLKDNLSYEIGIRKSIGAYNILAVAILLSMISSIISAIYALKINISDSIRHE